MGYYTQYSIFYDSEVLTPEVDKEIQKFVETLDGGGWEHYGREFWSDNRKWNDQEVDMYRLSKAFPDVLFTVSGAGDDLGDVWEEHWQDGCMQHCHMVILPYDPKQMVRMALDADGMLIKAPVEEFSQEELTGTIDIGEVV